MTIQDRLNNIKKFLFAADETAGAGDTAPADARKEYTTDAGARLLIDRLEVGGTVMAEDGTTAVVEGFTLADGTVVAVDEAGVITAVTAPVDAAADPAAPAAPVDVEARFRAIEEKLDALAAKPVELPQQFSDRLSAEKAAREAEAQRFSEQIQKFSTAFDQLLGIVQEFAAAPAADPAHAPSGAPPAETAEDLKRLRGETLLRIAREKKASEEA